LGLSKKIQFCFMITCFFENNRKEFLRHVAAGAMVIKDEKILLVKRAPFLLADPGKYCLPGGYLNHEEIISQAVIREVKEETGYEARIISLFRINDNPERDRGNVDFIYLVKPIKKIAKHDEEVTEVKWFELSNLPDPKQFAFDHWENIQLYLKWKKEKFKLPIFG